MSDTDSTTETQGDETGSTDTTTSAAKTFTQEEVDRILTERLGRLKSKYADYDDLKKRAASAMTEHEKAVVEAEARGRTAALSQTGAKLARAEFRAAASGRVSTETLDGFLEYADLSKFVGDDGEPDTKAIEAAVKKLGGTARPTNFDGGARSSAGKAPSMDDVIRRAAGITR